jgi:hypothetical protein
MVTRSLSLVATDATEAHDRVAAAIESTPDDAVVQLRITGAMPAMPDAAAVRAMAGGRTVTLAIRTAGHRSGRSADNEL